MKIKLKRILLGVAAALVSGLALAQTVLPPYLNGTDTSNTNNIFQVGMLRITNTNQTALTALAGGAQAGTALSLGLNRFTTVASGNDSAQLPKMSGGVMIVVINAAASNSMNVFGQTGQTINAGAANAAFAVAAGKTAIFFQGLDDKWYAVLTA